MNSRILRFLRVTGVVIGAGSACGSPSKAVTCMAVDAAPSPTRQSPPGAIDVFAALGPPAECVVCLRNMCGTSINACANSAPCREGLLCAMATCAPAALAKGAGIAAVDLGCLTGCFHNDLSAALQVVGAAACVTQQCGPTCKAMLPTRAAAIDAGSEKTAVMEAPLDAGVLANPVDTATASALDADPFVTPL